ncbi:delta-aminolevulinic acid dehydratase [Malassezia pachydermatis]|uniref:Delta-aminolevulinic acid dehydratase n=1 Tax=Malassezia pachydermatis TaxID=77020 RepID=A0A0M9VNY9_9BASI|nr:delta-aminolevulinic acid dehydratase [Malassezia pachydermatis]KOS13859.1 delta-aminolevulinic acid dehydratase [Malassezia pachydermatis]
MSTTSRIATIDWDNLHLEEKRAAEGEDEAAPESEEEDLGDYEDEVDDDYAQNYFDNGEDDDDIDADGGDEAAFD